MQQKKQPGLGMGQIPFPATVIATVLRLPISVHEQYG